MKRIRLSLLSGLVVNVFTAIIGYAAAIRFDSLGRLTEIIYWPSLYLGGLVFGPGGRSTLIRDIGFTFVAQWLLYSTVIFLLLDIVHRFRNDKAA